MEVMMKVVASCSSGVEKVKAILCKCGDATEDNDEKSSDASLIGKCWSWEICHPPINYFKWILKTQEPSSSFRDLLPRIYVYDSY